MPKIYGKRGWYLIGNDVKQVLLRQLFIFFLLLVATIFLLKKISVLSIVLYLVILGIFFIVAKFFPGSNRYYSGWSGEKEIEENLKELPEDYSLFIDLRLPGRKDNIDFIVVGQTGIFVVEAKKFKGQIFSTGKDLILNHKIRLDRPLGQAYRQAKEIEEYLFKVTGKRRKTVPVLAFATRFVGENFKPQNIKGVNVIPRGFLPYTFFEYQNQFSLHELQEIEHALKKLVKI